MIAGLQPNDEMKYKLYKSIESMSVLDAALRMRQCNIVKIQESTTMTWRLGVRAAPKKCDMYELQFKWISLVIKITMHLCSITGM